MNKKERQILTMIDRAFACNVQAHEAQRENSKGYLSYNDMILLGRTSHLDWYDKKDKCLRIAVGALKKYKKNKIRRGCSSDRSILYIQYGIQQMSFHRGGGAKRLDVPFFHGAWKKRINGSDYRFINN